MTLETILACALRSRRSFSALRRAVTSDLVVSDPWYRDIMLWVGEHVDRYGTMPGDGDAEAWLDSQTEQRRPALLDKWRDLRAHDLSAYTEEHLADAGVRVLRETAARTARHRLQQMGDDLDPESFRALADAVDAVRPVALDGLADLRDTEAHLRPSRDEGRRTATGITRLDHALGGGFERELVFLMAATGLGKTNFIVNRLAAAALRGASCLHVTLELNADRTMHRYYRRIARARSGEFYDEGELRSVEGRVSHWLRFAEGNVHVLYLPAYGPTVEEIRATAEMFADVHGLDVLAVDYLDLLARGPDTQGLKLYSQLGRLSHKLRNVCMALDVEVLTASQANREGIDSSKLTLRHMAGSIEKAQAADVVLGLVQSEEEAEVDQARIGTLKMRDYPGGVEIPVRYDKDRMIIEDLDEPPAEAPDGG